MTEKFGKFGITASFYASVENFAKLHDTHNVKEYTKYSKYNAFLQRLSTI